MIADEQAVFAGDELACREHLAEWVEGFQLSNILLVTGKDSYTSSGGAEFIAKALPAGAIHFLSDFSVNPNHKDLTKGIALCQGLKPDGIIALGGGSVLDMAKLLNFFHSLEIDPENYLNDPETFKTAGDLLPLMAVPSTAGTGSEATHFSVLYHNGEKHSVADARMLPESVLLLHSLTYGMSPYQTACVGFDALSQGIESFWACGSTAESRGYATKAIILAVAHLQKSVQQPDAASREAMHWAAYWSGKAINISKTTAAHAMSYPLTSHYNIPHGHAVAETLPAVLQANADWSHKDVCDPRGIKHVEVIMRDLISLLDCETSGDAVQLLSDLIENIGLSHGLSKRGVNLSEARRAVIAGINPERLNNNPCRLDSSDIEQIVSGLG